MPDVIEADILYGSNGKYVYANTNNILCNNNVFGNPQESNKMNKNITTTNKTNKCYYRKKNIFVQEPTLVQKTHLVQEHFTCPNNDNNCTNYGTDSGVKIFIILIIILVLVVFGFMLWYFLKKYKNT